MASGQLVHLRIAAHNPGRALAFYTACFGWRSVESERGEIGFETTDGLRGSFWAGGDPSSAGAELYVEVIGIEGVIQQAILLGGVRIARPGPGPGGVRVAHLLDCEGNRVCLWEVSDGGRLAGAGVP